MKKLFFAFVMAALLLGGCSKDDALQLPKAVIENLSGATSVSQGTTVNLRANVTCDLEYTISWSVNSQMVAEATGDTFDFISYQPDNYIIRLTVVNADGTDSDEITITVNNDLYVIDFEAASVLPFVATANGGSGVVDGGYVDAGSGIKLPASASYIADWDYWSWSGTAISQFNDVTTAGSANQLNAYYKDTSTGFSGYGGSKTYAVVYGGDITFDDDETEGAFDHFWVTNSAYAALSMKDGDSFGKKFGSGDWFKLSIEGYDKNDVKTGTTVEFYLADFRTATSQGIITTWTKVDLRPLGNKVHTVKFTLDSSDVGDWGTNTPAYFCFDNLAIKK